MKRLRCRLGWHDWTFVLITERRFVWIARHCRRCHWRDIADPLDHEPKGRMC